MPRNVRNFWIDARIDGRDANLAGGPRARDGGFTLEIYMRDAGNVTHPLTIEGRVFGNELALNIADETGVIVRQFKAQR